MSLFNNNVMMGASGAGESYEIERSLRFDNANNSTVGYTPSSAGDRRTWTMSTWWKYGGNNWDYLFRVSPYHELGGWPHGMVMWRLSSDRLELIRWNGASAAWKVNTSYLMTDRSAWYHFVCAYDTTQATASNRIKFYINGELQTSLNDTSYPAQNSDWEVGTTYKHEIGVGSADGYAAENYYIDGQALDASNFGETDASTGQWIPKAYEGTYGSNGWYVNFSDNSAATAAAIGKDYSGNGNNLTPTNVSVTAGPDCDSFEDTPTNNWCTLNPNKFALDDKATFSHGNLKMSHNASSAWQHTMGTIPVKSGKWYYEVKLITRPTALTENWIVGFYDLAYEYNDLYYGLSGNLGWGMDANNAEVFKDTDRTTSYGSAASAGDIIQLALDVDAEKFWVGINNTWTSSGDPAGGSNPSISSIGSGKTWIPKISTYAYNTPYGVMEANFGAQGFTYTPPTGFKAINAANALPEPTIKKGTDHFDTLLYTGNGSTQSITGLNFAPDLVWIKERSSTSSHGLGDTVRGAEKVLQADQSAAEVTASTNFASFDSNGFTHGNSGRVNESGQTYVAWNWKGSDSAAAANDDGTIDSTVSVNATAGFSVGTFSGTGSAGTIGHGLGVAPQFILIKSRENGNSWAVYHEAIGADIQILFNSSNATSADTDGFNEVPTSTVINVGSGAAMDTNKSGGAASHVFYAFSGVEGYSKFGKYTGNGIADGAFVYTGFKPALIIYKRTDTSADWGMHDNKRDSYNPIKRFLYPNLSDAEWTGGTNDHFDLLSNGFKARNTGTMLNASGGTYIYLAFAESPFKYSNAQ